MGLLEYQIMLSLRDVAHDRWLCNVNINYITAAGNYVHQLAAVQLLSGQPVRQGEGRQSACPSLYKITPAGSLSSSQPGGPPCWTSPLAFGRIGVSWKGGGMEPIPTEGFSFNPPIRRHSISSCFTLNIRQKFSFKPIFYNLFSIFHNLFSKCCVVGLEQE